MIGQGGAPVKRKLSEQQVLQKLTALCAKSEHCQKDMLDKMRRWEIADDVQARVMDYLVRERYVDDARYARYFINDKVKYNKWGRRKVEQALRLKGITENVYRDILNEVSEESYADILRPLIEAKRRTVKGNTEYEIRTKLIRFALSRGFDMDVILEVLDSI